MGKMRWQDEDQEGAPEDQFEDQDLNDQQGQELEDPSFQDQYPQGDFDGQDEQALAVMDEAVLRIEQANLYQTLLNHNLFAKGSARPEIIQKVQSEVRTFILSRLKVLLGIEQERSQEPIQVELPFDDEQLEFLKALADKGLRRTSTMPSRPVLNQVQGAQPQPEVQQPEVRQPQLNQVPAQRQQAPRRRAQPAPAQEKQGVVEYNGKKFAPRKSAPTPRRRRTANVSQIDGKDLSQAVNPANPPKPMPSQAQIDQMNAQQIANLTQPAQSGQGVNMVGLAAKLLTSGK